MNAIRFSTAVILALLLIAACGGGESASNAGAGTTGGNLRSCTSDSECSAGEGCNLEAPQDGYCSPLCDDDSQCPQRQACPASGRTKDGDCDTINRPGKRGVCDLFNGTYGPKTCSTAPVTDAG